MESFLNTQPSKILRAPSLKRGKPDERITDRIKLERVLGVTVSSNAALDSNPHTETVAYPAGCTVVLFNTRTGHQSHIINSNRKTVTSLAFSSCGRYLVTGECGHQPAVRVWDLQSDPQPPGHPGLAPQIQQIAEFHSHKYGVNCVAFSPTNKYVVSIGTLHDMIVNVWDWRNNIKVASNKVSTKVKSLAFAENGSYFVTVGNRHVKFWFLEYGKTKYKEAVPLMGRSAILGEHRNNYFCDVACGKAQCGDSTYAITRSGLLCEFNNRRLLDKWVELRTTSANCITVGEQHIFVGCAEGIVRCFDPITLRFITTLPRTHYLGVDVSVGLSISHMSSPPPDAKYPDTTAITYDETNKKLTCIYNDHSIYVWDVHNITWVGKSHSFLYHSACIWGVEMAPPHSPLPPGSFLTCSSDDTIRVWTLDKISEKNEKSMYRRNVYSNELLKVVYVDKELTYLKDLDLSGNNVGTEKQESSYDGRNGVRSIRISPDGKHLASGDRSGNIRIHETMRMKELLKIEAHDAEVLCLEYTNFDTDHKLMASASRDRLIHVFDVNSDYNFLQTLDDHSSSITAVRFLNTTHGNLQMVSCGADKSLIFRSLGGTPNGSPQFTRGHNATGKTTLYDMEVDASQKHVLTACQDRNVRIYSASNGKHTKSFKGSSGDDGTLIKVVLDRSGIYLATSCTDKSLSVYDYYTGECMATMCGHSELATGLRFTNDCRRLISASGDGCIFVWRVPHDMVVTMHARLSQQAMRQGKTLEAELLTDSSNADFYDSNTNFDRFSTGQLPLWAKKHISEDTSPPVSLTKSIAAPKGRWAQRAEKNLSPKSFYQDTVIPFPSMYDRRADSDGSKDSSLDSGTEIRQYASESRREIHISKTDDFIPSPDNYNDLINPQSGGTSSSNITMRSENRRTLLTDDSALGSLRDPDLESNAHDGDIDSDQEYRHQPLYYPTQIDSASGSEFTVTNMDVEELRKSMRRTKRSNVPHITLQSPTSMTTGSQESDDDDDEASTPSGENTDRNPMSMLSVSSESLDQIGSREKYLQSTFESLSGTELDTSQNNKSSISSQYLRNGTSLRNMEIINATKQLQNDSETAKKREELRKRIADTKKKLENVGHSPLKYSQSTVDLSHIPEKDKWKSPHRKQGNESTPISCKNPTNQSFCQQISDPYTNQNLPQSNIGNTSDFSPPNSPPERHNLPTSVSLPSDLQLCGCYMKDIAKNTFELSNIFNPSSFNTATLQKPSTLDATLQPPDLSLQRSPERRTANLSAAFIRPRKLQLDKTLTKYKMHKSLPVSPVSEECRFSDFASKLEEEKPVEDKPRRSFSYFIDFNNKKSEEDDFQKIFQDIEQFSQDYSKNFEELESNFKEKDFKQPIPVQGKSKDNDEEDGNFSSDSLEECSFSSTRPFKKSNLNVPPRRCVSNNEIYKYQFEEIDYSKYLHSYDCKQPRNEGFYLNQSNKNSQESILSYENELEEDFGMRKSKSYCNSMESVLSNESDCKSAPLEALFMPYRLQRLEEDYSSKSLPKNSTMSFCEDSLALEQDLEPSSSKTQAEIQMKRSQSLYAPVSCVLKTMKTSQTQTDLNFETPQEIVCKRMNTSLDFQKKLLKFETCIAQNENKSNFKRGIAFFVEAELPKTPEKVVPKPVEKVPVKVKNVEKAVKMETESYKILECPGKKITSKKSGKTKVQNNCAMYIPTLESKNKQYKSKFCNVLNNKPEINVEIFESGFSNKTNTNSFTLTNLNFEKSKKNSRIQESSSLDRHLLTKSLLGGEKITHKPPKAVRRHSSKTRKNKISYEYIKKEDYKNYKPKNIDKFNNENYAPREETTIELSYKEKNIDRECNSGNSMLLTELYDSLDKSILTSKIEHDSLEVNLNLEEPTKLYDSLEVDQRNLWTNAPSDKISHSKKGDFQKVINTEKSYYKDSFTILDENLKTLDIQKSYMAEIENISVGIDKIQVAVENIKILNEIQRKIHKINCLVDVYKQNMNVGKVKALSSMYESLTNSRNDPNKLAPIKFRRRNLSLPNFVERRLNVVVKEDKVEKKDEPKKAPTKPETRMKSDPKKVHMSPDSPENSLRRACSLSDLTVQSPLTPKARRTDSGQGKLVKNVTPIRTASRYSKSPMTRSSSMGVLNQQSDSETEPEKKLQNRLMRPTISSQNKVNNSTKITNIRKRHAHSVMNLRSVGQDDSSSEEIEKPSASSKPVAPPRTRLTVGNGTGSDVIRRPQVKDKPKANRNTIPNDRVPSVDLDATLTNDMNNSGENLDASTVELSMQLCDEVAFQLTKAANNVVKLHKRLTDDSDGSINEPDVAAQKSDMLTNLGLSIAMTMKMLQELTLENLNPNGVDVNQTDTVKKLNDLVSKVSINDQNSAVSMMQQYSDILLAMMTQKLQNSNI